MLIALTQPFQFRRQATYNINLISYSGKAKEQLSRPNNQEG